MDETLAYEIKCAYRDAFSSSCDVSTMYIPAYYETEQGDAVVYIDGKDWVHNDVFLTLTLGGHDLYFGNSNVPYFYYCGSFMSLNEAYDKELLTENDLEYLEIIFGGSNKNAEITE